MSQFLQPKAPSPKLHYEMPNHGLLFGYLPRVVGRIENKGGFFVYRFAPRPDVVDEAFRATRKAMKELKDSIRWANVNLKYTPAGNAYVEIYTSGLTSEGNIPGYKKAAAVVASVGIRMKRKYEIVPTPIEFPLAKSVRR